MGVVIEKEVGRDEAVIEGAASPRPSIVGTSPMLEPAAAVAPGSMTTKHAADTNSIQGEERVEANDADAQMWVLVLLFASSLLY